MTVGARIPLVKHLVVARVDFEKGGSGGAASARGWVVQSAPPARGRPAHFLPPPLSSDLTRTARPGYPGAIRPLTLPADLETAPWRKPRRACGRSWRRPPSATTSPAWP